MSFWETTPKTTEAIIGKKIYSEALYDRKGFHEDEIDDDIWQEIFVAMGESAIRAVKAEQ